MKPSNKPTKKTPSTSPSNPALPAKTGRPSLYSEELAGLLCERLAGGESLRAIGNDPAMPSAETVRRWLRDDEQFRGQYARAREAQADHYVEEIITIADAADEFTHPVARLRMDARKWVASKLRPKVYGDKLDVETTGTMKVLSVNVELIPSGPPLAGSETEVYDV